MNIPPWYVKFCCWRRRVLAVLAMALVAGGVWWLWQEHQHEQHELAMQDQCITNGGRWDVAHSRCQPSKH